LLPPDKLSEIIYRTNGSSGINWADVWPTTVRTNCEQLSLIGLRVCFFFFYFISFCSK
jgi:hypothetical protein